MKYVRGALVAVSISLVAILIFALLIRLLGISDGAIMPINQIIKILSIFFGVWFALRNDRTKGAMRGAIIGLVYTILAYLVFSILSGSFAFDISTFNDILFGTAIGAICGVIIVNVKKR